MKKAFNITASLAALTVVGIVAVAGTAIAQPRGMKAADANSDGNITRVELVAHLDKRFAKIDKDANGEITKEERKEVRASRRAERFAKLDTDGNGSLSPEEFQVQKGKRHGASGKKGGHHEGGRGKHHGRHGNLDANKDGVIEKAEFQARALERFDRIDTNNDDVVSAEERKAAKAKYKKHGAKQKPE